MMKQITKYLLLSALFIWPIQMFAQTAMWSIKPNYSSVKRYTQSLYKVKSRTSVGIVDNEGRVIVPVEADSITNLTEGYGLALRNAGGRYRLTGIFSESGHYTPIDKELYVGAFPFFSDRKLPVCDNKGKYGYIDTNGTQVLGFDYTMANPFSEGLAAVSKAKGAIIGEIANLISSSSNNKVIYIDEYGRELKIKTKIGTLVSGSTFKNGRALVIPQNSKNGRYIFINTAGEVVEVADHITVNYDKKYALTTGNEPDIEHKEPLLTYDGPSPYNDGTAFGYRTEKGVVLPAQFDSAEPFSGGYAIVSKSGKYGVLKLVDGEFVCVAKSGQAKSANKNLESVDYNVSIPAALRQTELSLTCEVGGSNTICTRPGSANDIRTFSLMLPRGSRRLVLSADRLILWDSNTLLAGRSDIGGGKWIDYISIAIGPAKTKANFKNIAGIAITLKNTSGTAIDVKVEVNGERLSSVNKTVTIEAGKSTNVYASFSTNGQTKTETRSVTAKITPAGSTESKTASKRIEVEPFFQDY